MSPGEGGRYLVDFQQLPGSIHNLYPLVPGRDIRDLEQELKMFRQITASRSGRKGNTKLRHKATIRAGEEETKLFSNRLRNAFEARFEPAAIYDRAGNQLRFLNRKTSGRDVFHGGAPREPQIINQTITLSRFSSFDSVSHLPPTFSRFL